MDKSLEFGSLWITDSGYFGLGTPGRDMSEQLLHFLEGLPSIVSGVIPLCRMDPARLVSVVFLSPSGMALDVSLGLDGRKLGPH